MKSAADEALRCRLRVTDPEGLHLRSVAAIAQTAARFQSTVVLTVGERCADGKSALDLMLLAAVQSAELLLEVAGNDAHDGMDAIVNLLTGSSWAEPLDSPDGPVA